jgi:hypothetical protein
MNPDSGDTMTASTGSSERKSRRNAEINNLPARRFVSIPN